MRTPPLTERERDIWVTFNLMRSQLDLTLERRLHADSGLSTPDYDVLATLLREPDRMMRSGRLAEFMGWEKSRLSHQLKRMEQRGLITRRECGDDARGVWVVATPDGVRVALAATRDRTAALREHFLDVLDDEQLAALRAISGKVLDRINPSVCTEEPAAVARTA
ncbi:MAG TPA: MarR family winged helix-turn-helix transcriptional regulator [Rhodoglobus sp.]|nr:MarR family winged helix-turn-helix transcriptional regulator [Rhodoglobus sp.]